MKAWNETRPQRALREGLLCIAVFASASAAIAQNPQGDLRSPVSCTVPAQQEFNRALALLHHMTYPQARESFRQVAAHDPRCAMAYWGIAMTLFQPMWPTRPGPAELQLGWQMVQKAESLRAPSEREGLYVAMAEAFFRNPNAGDYWERIRRWEQAAARAYSALPNDPEAAAFFALAHLAVAQAADGSPAHHAQAAKVLREVLAANPRHPGAMHYTIHANDIAAREHESLDVVSGYIDIAPDNPHALHMPTHIYVRLGDWPRVIDGNMKAAAAALRYPAGDRGQYVWDEFPHAIEYLMYGLLQRGSDDAARKQLERLQTTAALEPTFKTAFHLASTAARYVLERQAWHEADALIPRSPAALPWDRFPWPEAVTVFARGFSASKRGQQQRARDSQARLAELEKVAEVAGEDLFARNIRVLRLTLSAWMAHSLGATANAIALMRQAAELEEETPKHPVTPAPTLPARELLGGLLLEQGRPREALEEYQRALVAYPNRFNALLGAARAASQAGDSVRASTLYDQLRGVVDPASQRPSMNEVRQYLSQRGR